jgi:hypothetical protein
MSAIRPMNTTDHAVMEPLYDGGFRETTITSRSYQCLGCGLVWAKRWHAETCEERRHVATWQQRYVTGPIVNGRPYAERFYPRYAIERAQLPTRRER